VTALDELLIAPTEVEVAALLEAASEGLTPAGRLLLRRVLFDRDQLKERVGQLERELKRYAMSPGAADQCYWVAHQAAESLGLEWEDTAAVDVREAIEAKDRRLRELEEGLRQARACLLNLQPEELNPVQRQMQKMVGEISKLLGG